MAAWRARVGPAGGEVGAAAHGAEHLRGLPGRETEGRRSTRRGGVMPQKTGGVFFVGFSSKVSGKKKGKGRRACKRKEQTV